MKKKKARKCVKKAQVKKLSKTRPRSGFGIKETEVLKLAELGCSASEIARFYGCSHSNISRYYRDLIERGRESLKVSLRRKQIQKALRGNTPLLIWLGKQMLGQTEPKQGHVHEGVIKVTIKKH